jgi:hypothetical protein
MKLSNTPFKIDSGLLPPSFGKSTQKNERSPYRQPAEKIEEYQQGSEKKGRENEIQSPITTGTHTIGGIELTINLEVLIRVRQRIG